MSMATENPSNDPIDLHDTDEKHKVALQFIEDFTSNSGEVQNRVLHEILSQNAGVEYLSRHGLGNGDTDPETFKRLIPVVTYEDLKPDIDRIALGDTSPILCSQPISELYTSSGTSGGERKLIPITDEEVQRRLKIFSEVMPMINQFVPSLDKGKGMYFWFIKAEVKTPGGLVARPVITSFLKRSHFKNKPYNPSPKFTSPDETIFCLDSYQSMYSQLLCGLLQNEEVLLIGSAFASSLIRVIRFLEDHWPLLCNDIRTGTIDSQITDGSVRESVMRMLKPNPELAEFIAAECRKESWKGIITRLWPNTKYIEAIVTGTMSQYIPTLDYYSNGLPLVCTMYASSECYFGMNLNPICEPREICYTFLPNMAYFEFLPVSREDGVLGYTTFSEVKNEDQQLVDLVDVKFGEEYEIVVTTYAGLYRYRVGDILRVAGFKNKTPQFSFVCRGNVVLSIDTDKTDEVELQNAVKIASKHLLPFDATLLEYTSHADISTIPGHYVLYWEIGLRNPTSIPSSIFEDCCLAMEESLNSVYRRNRVSDKSIGPLEIKIVEGGTFDKLMDYAVNNGASINQYKTPRCLKSGPIVELLNSRVISSYFSPKCPKWVPTLYQCYT